MIRFRPLTSALFLKNITKHQKLRPNVLRPCHATDLGRKKRRNLHEDTRIRKSLFRKVAAQENLDCDDLIIQRQDEKETENIFKEIARGDEEVENQLQLLRYEIALEREEDKTVPNILLKKHWEELLKLKSIGSRKRYLLFLYKTEKKKEAEKIKEALKKRDSLLYKGLHTTTEHIYYGLKGYSMFLRIYQTTLDRIQDARAISNKLFASPILFDCSYQEYMNDTNTKYCASQLAYSLAVNRAHQHPCSLQLVNLNKNDLLMKYLTTFIPNINNSDMSIQVSEKSYLDLYPKERLVYLTPHCKKELVNFNDNDIYIIGAFVDKGHGERVSLAKAKENGLRMAKFPLDNYLLWRKGTKSLTLNNCLNILLDIRYYRNWCKALQSIPIRNLMD